jgi:putative membrane protein
MMNWDNSWGWGAWLMMGVFMLGFWALVAWVAVSVVRAFPGSRHRDHVAEEILAERFARGEIDQDEFTKRRETLHSLQ